MVGDFGFNLFFTTASLYLIFYYTDVLGLAPGTAGWVFAIALMWDAGVRPLHGLSRQPHPHALGPLSSLSCCSEAFRWHLAGR
jgi:hypothetical protein